MITIQIPITKEQLIANLNFIMQCTREAALPAKSHENVAAILNDLLAHLQPDEEPVKTEAPPKPIDTLKAKERAKAKQLHPKTP